MPEKKKIAVVAPNCFVGGVETALIGMMNIIDKSKYDITLFTNFIGNPCVQKKFAEINYENLDLYSLKQSFVDALSKCKLASAIRILKNYIIIKISSSVYTRDIYSCKHMDFKSKRFDVVIAYKHTWTATYIAKNAILAERSILWVHGALQSENAEFLQTLCLFDKCFCVSKYIKTYFLQRCPSLKDKTDIFHNILDAEAISKKAQEQINDIDTNRKYVLVTVGRLGQDKGQVVIPETARMLADAGIDFAWYIVGDGPERSTIEKMIEKYDVGVYVKLLGTKDNPYPYMNACTIYVQTSTSEGWCLTTQEARILHKPCVVTDIPVMHEQFVDGENGIIANGTDADSLYHGIMRLIESDELRNMIIDNLSSNPQDGANEVQKLYDYIEGK